MDNRAMKMKTTFIGLIFVLSVVNVENSISVSVFDE